MSKMSIELNQDTKLNVIRYRKICPPFLISEKASRMLTLEWRALQRVGNVTRMRFENTGHRATEKFRNNRKSYNIN